MKMSFSVVLLLCLTLLFVSSLSVTSSSFQEPTPIPHHHHKIQSSHTPNTSKDIMKENESPLIFESFCQDNTHRHNLRDFPSCAAPRLFQLGYPNETPEFKCSSDSVPALPRDISQADAFSKSYWYTPNLGECPVRLQSTVSNDNYAGPDSTSMFCSDPSLSRFIPPSSTCHPPVSVSPSSCTSCVS